MRLVRDGSRALGWALLLAGIAFPPFWAGYVYWYGPEGPFVAAAPPGVLDDVLGQVLVIALPEEAFYRGYLQTALDDALGARVRVLGAQVGPGLVVASAIFALGHLATHFHPARLAVFFPALVFGWLRARTGGIGAALTFHAMCNLFADYLGDSYGLAS
jgi:membrane protease YdiL (CAAX protease family)